MQKQIANPLGRCREIALIKTYTLYMQRGNVQALTTSMFEQEANVFQLDQ